ncbi:unnamed protein product [Angiostrongylus costaricensis]|uniref:BRCT domain-containing protein n=1 Tax=Angiostrongylus costaricensis TaxID=334426 RepID=A0A158PEC9_ANGCS|nr:unnamed protein product [Angiostrongylus costaricensis]
MEGQLESDLSEELSDTPPPQLTREVAVPENVAEHDALVESGEFVDNFSDQKLTATAKTSGLITVSLPQFVQPLMTSTQQPSLFLSQAAHARNDMFENEDKQEIRPYRSEKLCNYFVAKPKNTFHTRGHKVNVAPWLNLSGKKHTAVTEERVKMKCENNFSGTTVCRTSCETPRQGLKAEYYSNSRSRKSSFSTPKTGQCSSDPVIAAVIGGKLDDVQDAVEAGYDVNQRDDKKRTPLFIAVEMERLDICQCLVERGGAVINANCGSDCNTALHVAVSRGNEEIVKYLLSKGASKTIRNIRQQTPSQLAQPHSPLRLLVEKYRTHPKQPFVARLPDVYVVCISREIRKALSYHDLSIINKLMTVIDFCDETTTHYVVSVDADGACSSNADLLRAMMQNTRIMSTEWLNECIRQEKILPHTKSYEMSVLQEPGLFHGCIFYFLAKKYRGIDDRHLLRDLIRLGGGELSAREPKFVPNAPAPFHAPHLSSPLFIIYDVTVTANTGEKPCTIFSSVVDHIPSSRYATVRNNRASLCLYTPDFIPCPLFTYSRSARYSPVANLWAFSIHVLRLDGILALHATSLLQDCALSLCLSLKNAVGLFPPTRMEALHPAFFSVKFSQFVKLLQLKYEKL